MTTKASNTDCRAGGSQRKNCDQNKLKPFMISTPNTVYNLDRNNERKASDRNIEQATNRNGQIAKNCMKYIKHIHYSLH